MARKRIKDKGSVGRSELIPYINGEAGGDRHQRRLGRNLQDETKVRQWCDAHNIRLDIKNYGQHWILDCGPSANQRDCCNGRLIVEWWPSSAKMVIGKHWTRGIHVHDWMQLTRYIETKLLDTRPPDGTT